MLPSGPPQADTAFQYTVMDAAAPGLPPSGSPSSQCRAVSTYGVPSAGTSLSSTPLHWPMLLMTRATVALPGPSLVGVISHDQLSAHDGNRSSAVASTCARASS